MNAPVEASSCLVPEKNSGVLLVGHGTQDERGTQEFFQLGTLLDQQLGNTPVEPALLEFQEPTIPQAWQSLIERSSQQIRVAPLLLFAAGHAKSDIPDMVHQCQQNHTNVSVRQSRPLSRHRAIIELVVERIGQTFKTADADPQSTAIVMVGRGSHDPCAQTDMRILTEVVSRQVGAESFHSAFYAMAQPRLPDVLAEVARRPQIKSILVYPHLLFHGRLYQAIVEQTRTAAEKFPQLRFMTSKYLGPDQRVAQAIADRIEQC